MNRASKTVTAGYSDDNTAVTLTSPCRVAAP